MISVRSFAAIFLVTALTFTLSSANNQTCVEVSTQQGCLWTELNSSAGFTKSGDVIYSVGGAAGILAVPKTSIFLQGGYHRVINYNRYSLGGGIEYFLGPYNIYYVAPGYRAAHIWDNSDLPKTGYAHGPRVTVFTNVARRVTIGLGVEYMMSDIAGNISQEFDWNLRFRMII